jgi:hypothetical protein
MGDGGVACVPLQHVMERFSISETICQGKNGKFNAKSLKFTERKMKMKLKKEESSKRGELKKSKKVENGQVCAENVVVKEEVEEGELGSLKWPAGDFIENGEYIPERPRRFEIKSEIEKGEVVAEKWNKEDDDRHEFVPGKWRKWETEKVEFSSGRFRRDDTESGSHRVVKDDVEKGEFIPDRWRKSEVVKNNNSNNFTKMRWHESPKDKYYGDKDFSRNGNQPVIKRSASSRWENDRIPRIEEPSLKNEFNNGRGEYSSGNRLKRHVTDTKHHTEFGEYTNTKSRRISDEYSRQSEERPYRAPFRNNNSSDRYSSRHHESSGSSRVGYDRYCNNSINNINDSPRQHHGGTRHHNYRDRSPYDRNRHFDHRNRSPSYSERSPQDQSRYHDKRDRTPNFPELSPVHRSRPATHRRSGAATTEKRQIHQEEKVYQRDNKDPEEDRSSLDNNNNNGSIDDDHYSNNPNSELVKEEESSCPKLLCKESESPQANTNTEEILSMEEDMDICDTPPHVPAVTGSSTIAGKWFYLDSFGVERGPSKLCDLKILVEDGVLVSDQFIKHSECNRWVTVENATSPLVTSNFPSIVSESVTELVSPPEASGNLLSDIGERGEETLAILSPDLADSGGLGSLETFHIDERVGTLLEGFTILPGKELETVGEVLKMTFDHEEWEKWGNCEGLNLNHTYTEENLEEDPMTHSEFLHSDETDDWFSIQTTCKGGDWKRNDEFKKKIVLNDGYPLCQLAKSGYEDPRWHNKDELYPQFHSRRLDLPLWAFSTQEEHADPKMARGIKGISLPVIRINTCVVRDHGSLISEPKVSKRKERAPSRSATRSNLVTPSKSTATSSSKKCDASSPSVSVSVVQKEKDRLCTTDDLQLHLGEWYYLDGVGHERGPLLFSELQVLAERGIIQKQTSVFRKFDKVWVPVTTTKDAVEAPEGSRMFHGLHPQFIGYARGKIHELVMKSYRSREFAAAINEVLDPWINARQPRKELEKHIYNPSFTNQFRNGKRSRLLLDGSDGADESDDDTSATHKVQDYAFDELCGDADFGEKEEEKFTDGSEIEKWGLLNNRALARVFHFLRADLKSLAYAAFTCKHWRSVVRSYKDISKQADLSSVASNCTDSKIFNIVKGYNKVKVTSLILRGCTGISPGTLEEILQLLPSISHIDIRGCTQFEDLSHKFPNINWVKARVYQSKLKTLDNKTDDSSGLRDYLESLDKRDTNQMFRRSLYKRSKLYDARRSSSILSRGAHLRNLAIKRSGNGYKKMEEFLASSLEEIMKDNSFHFFVPKVAEIEDRIKNGYYASHGLSSVKEDISRMCTEALKGKNRGDSRELNRIITLFIRLAMNLEASSKSLINKDGIKTCKKDDSPPGFSSVSSRYKKLNKLTDKKFNTTRSNGSFNGGITDTDHGSYASDREIRRRLSKLNKKSLVSGSETTSSEATQSDSESSASDSGTESDSRRESGTGDAYIISDGLDLQSDDREWGARMTKASLVPPVTRKYEVIDHYVIVEDHDEVERKMRVSLPEDYKEKVIAQKNGTEESDMEIPEVKDYKPRKTLGDEVIEQEVYGIDPYTHNLLLDSMPGESDWSLLDKHLFIEDVLLRALNKKVRDFTGTGNTPMKYPLQPVVEGILKSAQEEHDSRIVRLCQFMLTAIHKRPEDNYVAYRKGLGVVCNKEDGFGNDDFVVEFLGEVYPSWKWFEKQDGIRSLQEDSKEPAPEFYNIYLERPKGDADGYDLVVVDAMHKANYASRICHSCRPNCEAKVTAVDGHYQIGIYSVRPIGYGEEITFDYNSVTESKEEYEASVCLCGSQVCRGSYLNLTGEGAYQKVLKEWHGILDRHHLMLEACEFNSVTEEDYIELGKAGLGSCLLGGLPDWLIAYAARLVRFINFERVKLPEEILKHSLEEKRKYFVDVCLDVEKNDAEVQAEGVYNQRLQNLALTLDKVRYVMRCNFGDPKKAPPPLEKLTPEESVSHIWKGEGSLIEELIQCMAPHMDDSLLKELKSNIRAHDPSGSDNIQKDLRKSLIWLRDEVRNLPCTYKSRHDAAADLIHIYAYTKCFFRVREYKAVTSPPVYISPLDLGPKYTEKLGPGFHEYRKSYGENYCLGQLIFWHNQTNAEPDCSLAKATKGCLSLPDVSSFYAKIQKPSRQRVYGPRTLKFMLARMEKQPQRPWPKDRIWSFENTPKVFGSPMLDAVLRNGPLDKDMIHWLKHRPPIFHAMWDR